MAEAEQKKKSNSLNRLNLVQIQALALSLLDFTGAADFVNWLNQNPAV
jgi:Domain of unknown function (DUF4351)